MEYGVYKEENKEGYIGETKPLDLEKINAETVETSDIEEIKGVEEAPLEEVTNNEELATEEVIEG